MSHANISVFVPHLGCPHKCSFCDQTSITGETKVPNDEDVLNAVEVAKLSKNYSPKNTELAFFGGSFTAIDKSLMVELLSAGKQCLDNGFISGIRISTRPDCINEQILDTLKYYGVTAIELGAQSMCDSVLCLNKRGHTAQDVVTASKLIKQKGFSLGLQMMTGLYGSSEDKDKETAKKIIELSPDTVRIYPTVILKGTLLEYYYKKGIYSPPSLDSTVDLCIALKVDFEKCGIKVIRVGLHSIDSRSFVAGGWHPSFGELCESRMFLNKVLKILEKLPKGSYILKVNPKDVSKVIGNKRANIVALKEKGYFVSVKGDENTAVLEVVPERMNNSCI